MTWNEYETVTLLQQISRSILHDTLCCSPPTPTTVWMWEGLIFVSVCNTFVMKVLFMHETEAQVSHRALVFLPFMLTCTVFLYMGAIKLIWTLSGVWLLFKQLFCTSLLALFEASVKFLFLTPTLCPSAGWDPRTGSDHYCFLFWSWVIFTDLQNGTKMI